MKFESDEVLLKNRNYKILANGDSDTRGIESKSRKDEEDTENERTFNISCSGGQFSRNNLYSKCKEFICLVVKFLFSPTVKSQISIVLIIMAIVLLAVCVIFLFWLSPQYNSTNIFQYHSSRGPNDIITKNAALRLTNINVYNLREIYFQWTKYKPVKSYQETTYWTKGLQDNEAQESSNLLNKILTSNENSEETVDGTEVLLRSSQKRRVHVDLDVEAEALASLNLAIEMRLHDKMSKAQKLYKHALNLDPFHADILNAYGEFIEEHQKDVVKAEHLYTKALMNSPKHSKAMQNRQRTLPLVEEIDNENFQRIDHKRNLLYNVPDNDPLFRRAKRESYFQHIHHTTAIEGNTLALMEIRYILESGNAVNGKSIMEHNEIIGMDYALAFINSTLLNRVGQISQQDIIEIHRRVLGWVDPLSAGIYRRSQVYVGDFKPPPASSLHTEMSELIEWINSDEALSLHPIELAALAHYRLVYIHPFIDGNGRTSRLLMNVILMQAGFPPVIIRLQDRLSYYEALKEANDGDIRPFIRFIAQCTERTLNWFLHTTNTKLNDSRDIRDVDALTVRSDRVIIIDNDDEEEEIDGANLDDDNISKEKCSRTNDKIPLKSAYDMDGIT